MLVGGRGRIVAEYFDVGQNWVLPWARRLHAAALLAAMADPGRGFDAMVIGENERAFYGSQYSMMAPLFEHYGIQLWTLEAGGRLDFQAEGARPGDDRAGHAVERKSPGRGSGH
jgi:site-specific DNA recombinase